MNIGRIFANAIVRRLAYVLVALVLAWVGLGDARAATYNSQGAAYAGCKAAEAAYSLNGYLPRADSCSGTSVGTPAETHDRYECIVSWQGGATFSYGCGYLQNNFDQRDHHFPRANSCAAKPNDTFTHADRIPTGSHGCASGCQFVAANNGDGTYTRHYGSNLCNVLPECLPGEYLHVGTSLCMTPEDKCDPGQIKDSVTGACEDACPATMVQDQDGLCVPAEDTCPPGNIRSPDGNCLPGEGQCAAGEARRPNGTCGRDSDGDGEADEDDEDTENDPEQETASGGDSCNAPPSCSGGAIDCMQVKIQWRIDCNTRSKATITGGTCAAMPVCTGDGCKAMEYAQLIQQWKTTCALAALGEGGSPGGGGDGDGSMDPVSSDGVLGNDGYTGETARRRFGQGSSYEFDVAGYGWGGSCPAPPDVNVFGHTISFDTSVFCSWMSLGGVFVMIMAHLAGLAILWRA